MEPGVKTIPPSAPAVHPQPKICLVPRLGGLGGPASFQGRLVAGLAGRGIAVGYDLDDPACRAILVIGGTVHLDVLWRAHRRGVRIVQRLNGMNWIHRKRRTGLRHFLRSEINNWILAAIRRRLADRIVYQSGFSQSWWERVYGPVPAPARVVYNGIDLDRFTPTGPRDLPQDRCRLLMVEGHLGGGNEDGLLNGIRLAEALTGTQDLRVELTVAGDAPAGLRAQIAAQTRAPIRWAGAVPRERVPELDRSAHLLFSADLNAACPNSVIEALACGLPVVAFDTGALREMVLGAEAGGAVVPYGGDHWNLEPPDIDGLARVSAEVLADLPRYREAARARAEAVFGLPAMIDGYLESLQ